MNRQNNNEMNLQSLIEKYDMQEGDEVLCTDPTGYSLFFKKGIKVLAHYGEGLGFYEGREVWEGSAALFKLPERSPYLNPVHEFVRSCQPNTAENQKALFELGYAWRLTGSKISNLGARLLFTNKSGLLTTAAYFIFTSATPQRYSFKTVAVLLPETPVESETLREIRLATEELEAVTKRLKALKAKGE